MVDVGRGRIIFEADTKPALDGLKKFGADVKGGFGQIVGGDVLGGIQSLAGSIPGVGIALGGVAVAAAGVGKALIGIGLEFDEAFDTIAVGTGATGQALEGLKGSFKTVFATVPADAAEVGQVIADLNTRLGVTGPTLEGLAEQILEASKILGFDAAEGVEVFSQALNQFKVPVDQAGPALDKLFKISQATGIEMTKLGDEVARNGPVLQGLGFSFDEAAALLANLNKQGVEAGPIMSGLGRALANSAKEGESAPETFRRVVSEIKNMKDPVAATQAAMELFGTRAGPQLAQAIRAGQLSVDDLVASIQDSEGAIISTADATKDFPELWKEFGNQAKIAIEPLASALLPILGEMLKTVGPILTDFAKGFATFVQAMLPIASALLKAAIIPMKIQFGILSGALQTLKPLLDGIARGFDIVRRAIERVVEWFKRLIERLGFKLPGWLTKFLPGSPPPLEVGFRAVASGIAAARREFDSLQASIGRAPILAGAPGTGTAFNVQIINQAGVDVGVSPSGPAGLVATIRARGIPTV